MYFARTPTWFILRNTVENYAYHPLIRLFGAPNTFDHTLLFEKKNLALITRLPGFPDLLFLTLMSECTRVSMLPFSILQLYYICI